MNDDYIPLHGTIIEKNDIPLPVLADRIRELLVQIAEKSGPAIWEVGNLLRIAHLDFPGNANFGNWCSANFAEWPLRTLYDYCQLADKFYQRQELVKLIPQSGLYLLAAPKCDEFREEIVEEIEFQEERVSVKTVQKAIRSHMPASEKADTKPDHPFTNDQVTALWKAFEMADVSPQGRLHELLEEVKVIIGEPKEI